MARIVFVHWHRGEAAAHARKIRSWGHTVRVEWEPRGAWLRTHWEHSPDAFVIVLDRVPSQGREVGAFVRRTQATRFLPLVFVGVDATKVDKVRALWIAWPKRASGVSTDLTEARVRDAGLAAGYVD